MFITNVTIVYLLEIVFTNLINTFFQSTSLLVFFTIILTFETRICRQKDVLISGGCADLTLFVTAEPCHVRLTFNCPPTMSCHFTTRYWSIFSQVQCDVLRLDTRFKQSCFWMYPTSSKQLRRLYLISINFLHCPIDNCKCIISVHFRFDHFLPKFLFLFRILPFFPFCCHHFQHWRKIKQIQIICLRMSHIDLL